MDISLEVKGYTRTKIPMRARMDKVEGEVLVSIGSIIVGYLLSFLGESFGKGE